MSEITVAKRFGGIAIDKVSIDRTGILSVDGWDENPASVPKLQLRVAGEDIALNESHRVYRPDVAGVLRVGNYFLGFSFEYLIQGSLTDTTVEILLDGRSVWSQAVSQEVITPHFAALLNQPKVEHRDGIYGFGPPGAQASEEVLRLVGSSVRPEGTVLDFGCGSGNTIAFLRQKGIEAFGVELDRPGIRDALRPDCQEFIRLYQGELPLPFDDGEFDSVLALEVLEHLPDYRGALREIRRISKHMFIVTVPDASSIPRCYPHQVVPWHLLESTHLNFFTERSLRSTLSEWWGKATFLKIGHVQVNESSFATSIAAVCERLPD